MIFLLGAGIAFLLAGLASIVFGVPVKEFSFGNTLILSGVIGGCTGAILVGLYVVGREIRALADATAAGVAAQRPAAKSRPVFPPSAAQADASGEDLLFPGDRAEPEAATAEPAAGRTSSPARPDDAAGRDRIRARAPEAEPAPPSPPEPTPKKRNLLFSSSTRRDRERAESGEGVAARTVSASRSFDDAWPQPERPRDEAGARRRRPLGSSDTAAEPAPTEQQERLRLPEPSPAPRSEEMTEVTVLKSGVVDGMAYSLYSDGSIEAQMPEGMMRFESIDALREHLDQRS